MIASSGDVWGWGNNSEDQLGLGNNTTQRQPVVIPGLQGKNIRQISAGRNHSAAWTAPLPPARTPGTPLPLQLGHPTTIPPQFPVIKGIDTEAVRARLRVLYHFSDLISSCWRLMNLKPDEVSIMGLHFFCRILPNVLFNYLTNLPPTSRSIKKLKPEPQSSTAFLPEIRLLSVKHCEKKQVTHVTYQHFWYARFTSRSRLPLI